MSDERCDFETAVKMVAATEVRPDLILPLIAPSDNERKIRTHTGMRTSPSVRRFQSDVDLCLGSRALPPPPLVLVFRCYFTRLNRDPQNCQKALVDALYIQDKHVLPWALPARRDKNKPRTEIWFVRIAEEE